jgi:Uma2 family endonuclease
MAITAPRRQRLDWEAYLRWEDDLTHYEIIDGEVHPLPTPILKHQLVQARLSDRIRAHLNLHRLGELLAAPFDFVVRRNRCARASPTCFSYPAPAKPSGATA